MSPHGQRQEPMMRCYRAACNSPAHPCGYNRITHGLYCLDCAHLINAGSLAIDIGSPLYPLLPFANDCDSAGSGRYVAGVIVVRGAQIPV